MTAVLLRSARRTARKAHPCSYCRQPAVQPGGVYVRDTFVFDGQVYDWITCTPCEAVWRKVWDWMGPWDEAGITGEDCVEWARENPDDPDAVAFLERADPS